MTAISIARKEYIMSLKRKIFNIFAAVVMVFGSMPVSFLSAYAEEPAGDAPKSLKTVKTNNDGTYDITLEIEGVSSNKTDATKANVVVVFDSSGSMGDSATTYTYSANSSGRYRKVNGDYVQLYRRSGIFNTCNRMNSDNSTTNVYTDSSCSTLYTGTRYTRTTVNGTRLSVAKTAVNVLANELLSQNDPNTAGFEDVVEMAFVDFATNVNSVKGPTTSLSTFRGWVNGTNVSTGNGAGTNWEAALTAAKGVSFGEGDNDKTYVIFVSDGNPTFRSSKYNDRANDCRTDVGFRCPPDPWGQGGSDSNGWNLGAAQDVADTIVSNTNMELYAIGAFGDATNMQKLGGTYYNATNQDALETAFADIVDKITMGLSVADLQIEDGITAATSTEISGTAGHFRYNVPESWGTDYAKATFEGGSVHWNPGHDKTLTNGEKASVTFTVWPSQEAMDCIAAIRNSGGCNLSDEELASYGLGKNSDGSYRLITNSKATFRYRTATKIEGTNEVSYSALSPEPGEEFDELRDPTNLPETTLSVTKLWTDGMDPGQRNDIKEVSLNLYVDREDNSTPERSYTFSRSSEQGNEWVGKDENGKSTYTVAPGVMKKLDGTEATEGLRNLGPVVKVGSDEYVVLEPGHDYEFDNETYNLNAGGSNHYHITKRKYHPMIIGEGGKIHDVVFSEDGKTAVIEEVELTELSAENTLNGGILVSKDVINNGKKDTTITDEYEITINLTGADSGQYRIYTYNDDGSVASRTDKIDYTGGKIKEKIRVNQKIMVTDVPTGTKFEVSETKPEGYDEPKIDYLLIKYDGTENEEGVHEVFGNTSATATVTNTLESGNLIVKKNVTASSGDLTEAQKKEFSFTIKFYKNQGDTTPVRTDTETCKAVKHGETCEIKNIPEGWYYEIVEAAKSGFNGGQATTKTGTIAKGDNEVKFTNDYAVTPLDPDDAKILAVKAFASGYESFWIPSDQFTFVMTGNGETIESAPLTLSGSTAEFIPTIADDGTYTYTITEKTTDENNNSLFREGVSRLENDEDIVVTIVVKDNGDGTLGLVSKTYSKKSQTIYNKYEGDNTYGGKSGELEFTKSLTGRDWRSTDKFDFTISSKTEGAPMPKETTITADKDHQTVGFGKIKFTNKDVGNTYTYTVTESFDVPSVEATGASAGGISLTIEVSYNTETGKIDLTVSDYENTFTNEYKTTDVTAAKVWNDDKDRDGLRENYSDYYVAVKNDVGKFVAYEKLELEDKDDYKFTNLPKKNAEGKDIKYTVVEASTCSGSGETISCTEFTSDKNYTATVANGVITNKHVPELINEDDDDPDNDGKLTVQKIWDGEGNELARPDTITIELYANGKILGEPVALSAATEWKYTFEGLYKNEGGEPIEYSVQESKIGENAFGEGESTIVVYAEDDAIAGSWTKKIENYDVTNTWKEATDTIEYNGADKFYIKKVNEDYKPLKGVTFTVGGKDEVTDADGMISKSVPVSADEKEESFKFVVTEKETLEEYDLVEGSATVTVACTSVLSDTDAAALVNTYTKTCEFKKTGSDKYVWDDTSKTLTVVNNRSLAASLKIRKEISGVTKKALENNGLTFTLTGPDDFAEQTIGFDEFSETDEEGVYEYVVSGKVPTGNYTVVESNAEFKDLLDWTVSGENDVEKAVSKGDEAEFTIKNSYAKIRDVHYAVEKVWVDDGDRDAIRPESLKITLLRNDKEYRTVDLIADDWAYEWTDLPRADENAMEYTYSVIEEDVTGYESDGGEMVDGVFTFTNTHEPELINGDDDNPDNDGKLKVTKTWSDENNRLSTRPANITVKLYADGEQIAVAIIAPDRDGNWEHTFENLYKYDQGEEIEYTVEEANVDGYKATYKTQGYDYTINNSVKNPCIFGGCGGGATTPDTGVNTGDRGGAMQSMMGAMVMLGLVAMLIPIRFVWARRK